LEQHLPHVLIGEAESGWAALELARRAHWDVVVLDIVMPGKSGIEVLGEMVRFDRVPAVLMLSMHAEEQYARRVMEMGAAGYITKIKAPLTIVEAVKCVMGGGRYFSSVSHEREAMLSELDRFGAPAVRLSRRETQVLKQITSGKPQKEIAADLAISSQTVSTHRARILRKLGRSSTAELIRYALEHGLVE